MQLLHLCGIYLRSYEVYKILFVFPLSQINVQQIKWFKKVCLALEIIGIFRYCLILWLNDQSIKMIGGQFNDNLLDCYLMSHCIRKLL